MLLIAWLRPVRGSRIEWLRHFALAATLVVCAAGCKKPASPPPCATTFGDPTQPMQIVPGETRLVFAPSDASSEQQITGASFVPLQSGGPLDLYMPPQGGHVAYIAARVTNVVGCDLSVRSILLDPTTGDQVQYEERQTTLVAAAEAPGWGEPDPLMPESYANVPLCPDYVGEDIIGVPYDVEVIITDSAGRSAHGTVAGVVPQCSDSDPHRQAVCQCECRANYSLGKCQDVGDGGAPADGGARDAD